MQKKLLLLLLLLTSINLFGMHEPTNYFDWKLFKKLPPEIQKSILEYATHNAAYTNFTDDLITKNAKTIQLHSPVCSVAFSPCGTKVFTGSNEAVNLFDISHVNVVKPLHTLPHNSTVKLIAFSTCGTKALTGSYDQIANLWDTSDPNSIKLLHVFTHKYYVFSAAFSPCGTKVFTGSYKNAFIFDISDVKKIQRLCTVTHDNWIYSGAFSPDGTKVLTGSLDKTAKLWDISDVTHSKLLHTFPRASSWIKSVAFIPCSTKVLIQSQTDTLVLDISDLTNVKPLRAFMYTGSDNSVPLSLPCNTKILIQLPKKMLLFDISDLTDVKLLLTFTHTSSRIRSVALSPCGTKVLTGSNDCTAKLWDISLATMLNDIFQLKPSSCDGGQYQHEQRIARARFMLMIIDAHAQHKTVHLNQQDKNGRYGLKYLIYKNRFSPKEQQLLAPFVKRYGLINSLRSIIK